MMPTLGRLDGSSAPSMQLRAHKQRHCTAHAARDAARQPAALRRLPPQPLPSQRRHCLGGTACPSRRYPQQDQQQQQRGAQAPAALPEALAFIEASPGRDVAAALLAAGGSLLLVKFFDTLERMGWIDKKLSRKLVHTLAGPGFLACWPLFGAAPYSRFIAATVPALNMLRLLLVGSGVVKDERTVAAMSRSGDPRELLRGPLYYVAVLIAITTIYWRTSPVGLIIASLMCGGDGLADIVGRRLGGGNPLPWNREKSWAGSAAMFGGGLAASLSLIWLFSGLGYFEAGMPAMGLTVAAISLAATLVESLPVNQTVDDNLSVPGVAAFLGILFLQVAVEVL